jgi:xylulokinase
MADVLDRPIRQVEHPVHANTRGAALLAALALERASLADISRAVRIEQTYEPRSELRATYDTLYREFRALHKQNRQIYARLNRHG